MSVKFKEVTTKVMLRLFGHTPFRGNKTSRKKEFNAVSFHIAKLSSF